MRKNILAKFLALIFASAVIQACSSDSPDDLRDAGFALISLSVDEIDDALPVSPFSLTLSTENGEFSNTWPDMSLYLGNEPLRTGLYTAFVSSSCTQREGYGCPAYEGIAAFSVHPNMVSNVTVNCRLAQALVYPSVRSDSYPLAMSLHTCGNAYINAQPEADSPLLLMPSATSAYVTLSLPDGNTVTIDPSFSFPTVAAERYAVEASLSGNTLSLSCGTLSASMPITPLMLQAPEPTIEPSGFVSDQTLYLVEGNPASQPVAMKAIAPAGLSAIYLSTADAASFIDGIPAECDLLSDPQAFERFGLATDIISDSQACVDFTKLLENLCVNSNSCFTFTLRLRDALGRLSEPAILKVEIKSVDIDDITCTPAVVGTDITTVTMHLNTKDVDISDFSVRLLDNSGNDLGPATIIDAYNDPDSDTSMLSFSIGKGSAPVPVEISFMGERKLSTVIQRQVPEYTLIVDAYASSAVLSFRDAEPEAIKAITEMAVIYANGLPVRVLRRLPDSGYIWVGGLMPQTKYSFKPIVVAGGFSPEAVAATEAAAQVPSGDFEDARQTMCIKHLPQGGPYSASEFPIYNMQNYTDFDIWWPDRDWANVNVKTCSSAVANANTWYMQPSAVADYSAFVSGTKSIRISSVGWSLDGPQILPYAQQPGTFLPYNDNAPRIAHRSAGRLFLGSYFFDPASLRESYYEGMPFASRPTSLNGFYKYSPDPSMPSDCGYVCIELLNDDADPPIVIAHGTALLSASPDFIAFNVPLEYKTFAVKASRLKIMFASSANFGSIEYEDSNIAVSPYPALGAYIGSTLWIDNLSFSY